MSYIPIASFGRQVGYAHLDRARMAEAELPPGGIDKWSILREVSAGRTRLGLSDRSVTLLQVLLSFHPETLLDGTADDLVVFPSNAAICSRLNGMPSSTMRRHLAALVASGLVLRRDSPNGKRFKRRGEATEAYGFDLRPLLLRHAEICAAAEAVRAETEALSRLRRTVSLMRRDLASLADYGADVRPDLGLWQDFAAQAAVAARTLRRKVSLTELEALASELQDALDTARDLLEGIQDQVETENPSTRDVLCEQHIQDSKLDIMDTEPAENTPKTADAEPNDRPMRPVATCGTFHRTGCEGNVHVARLGPKDDPQGQPASGTNTDREDPDVGWKRPEALPTQRLGNAQEPTLIEGGTGDGSANATQSDEVPLPTIPLGLVLTACPALRVYVPDRIRHWHDLVRAAETLGPMIGIPQSAWQEATEAMGHETAAVVVAAMLERFSEIRSPGGYLRALARRAEAGRFSCGPMVMALLRRTAA